MRLSALRQFKMNLRKISALLLLTLPVISFAGDKVDIAKLKKARQQNRSTVVPAVTISLAERKQAYEQAKNVKNESILGSHARKMAQDLAKSLKEHNFVFVQADCTKSWGCIVEKFRLSGPSDVIIADTGSSSSTSITKLTPESDYSGIYHYFIKIEDGSLCAGKFYFDGKSKNIFLNVFNGSCKLTLNTF